MAAFEGSKEAFISGIQSLAERSDRIVRLEQSGVFADLIDYYGDRPAMAAYLGNPQLGTVDLHAAIKRDWHPRFQRGLELIYEPKLQTRVLCAFGAVVDRVYHLEQPQVNSLETWAEQHKLNGQSGGATENKIKIPLDIIDTLEIAFCDRGRKPIVDSPELRSHLCTADFPLQCSQISLGGAAGIIAEALAQLDVDTRVYSMYHPIEQAMLFDRRLKTKWLDLSTGNPKYYAACESGQTTHPTRYTMVLTYATGVRLRSRNVKARQTDRSLLLLKHHFGNASCSSPSAYTIDNVDWHPGSLLGPLEWPSVTGFVYWQLQHDTNSLAINFLGDDVLALLAGDHHYIILSAPSISHLQHPADPAAAALLSQLRALKRANATMHLEISGGANAKKDKFLPFANELRETVQSLGINDSELAQFALLPDFWPNPQNDHFSQVENVYHRYLAGLRLAEALDLDRLYIHGNDVDIVLRRGASEAAMQQELRAILFAKGAVVVSILLRNDCDPSMIGELPRALAHKGFYSLVEFGWAFSNERCQDIEQRNRTFKHIVHNGYYLADTRKEYSIVIAPVMWPDIMSTGLNTTGAGDICSGLSLLYSGW